MKSIDKIKEILEKLSNGTHFQYEQFIESLKATNQMHAVEVLTNNAPSEMKSGLYFNRNELVDIPMKILSLVHLEINEIVHVYVRR